MPLVMTLLPACSVPFLMGVSMDLLDLFCGG